MSPPRPSLQPLGAPVHSLEKDVQAMLLKQKSSHRRPGEVPYPLNYSLDMVNLDNWDQMFLQSCFGGLTMHQFETPPTVVLDLGCGSGYWALEAARTWPNARIIGFDVQDIQPELLELDAYYMRCLEDGGHSPHPLPLAAELAARVKWVHGNFLDGLPFPPDHFDFVHISGIGLGVPEDEWQFVLEEVSRVMQPNGVLEIVEEDLIFPCVPARPARTLLAPLSLDFTRERKDSAPPSAYSTRSSNTALSDFWSIPDTVEEPRVHKKTSLPTLPEAPTYSDSSPSSSIPFDIGSFEPPLTLRNTTYFPQDTESDLLTPDYHPQDHTRLKTAWDAMLTRRFLAKSVITVLPFYLSSFFENIQTHPSLQIPLPPSSANSIKGSRSSDDSFDADALFDLNPSSRRLSDADVYSVKSKSTGSSHRTVPFWGRMHLAKTVSTVTACKEAIYLEYERLFPSDLPPSVTKTARTKEYRFRQLNRPPREAFEKDWSSWENDMADRIAMRGRIASEFGWTEPDTTPEWKVWRNRISSPRGEERLPASADLCRSLRAFVGWKPAAS